MHPRHHESPKLGRLSSIVPSQSSSAPLHAPGASARRRGARLPRRHVARALIDAFAPVNFAKSSVSAQQIRERHDDRCDLNE